ncbi:MAG: hypothetical protein IPK04_14325 [Bdellovibrionales bacterium]|nr:hypothetical protein [Bdellovibrionales bacterium]
MNAITSMIGITILSLGLIACGGGSGGSSTSLPSDGGTNPGGGNGGGGSTGGGNGTASYYGFNSANSIVSNALPPFVSGEQFVVDSEVAIIVSDLDNRTADYMIYEPICLSGVLSYDYNAVLVKGDPTAPSRVRISASSSSTTITEYTELQSGAGYVDKTTETNTGVCNNGEFYSSVSQWVVFQNGRSILLKDMDNNIYFGFRNQLVDKSLLLAKQYKVYHQLNNGAVDVANKLNTWSSASASVVNLDASSSPSNSAFGFSSPHTTAKGFASTTRGSHYTIHGNFSRIYDNQTATVPMMGISATLSGKNISIHNAVHRTCGSGDVYSHNGQTVCDTVGSGAVSFYFEQ